jgi:hypothetical protein
MKIRNEPGRQVINHDNPMPRLNQPMRHNTADVPSTPSNKQLHRDAPPPNDRTPAYHPSDKSSKSNRRSNTW